MPAFTWGRKIQGDTSVGKSERIGHLRGEDVTSILNTCFAKRKARTKTPLEIYFIYSNNRRLRWSRGSVLAFSTLVRGFKPGRNRRIFRGEKILSTPSFGGEVKPSVPCRRFAACKRPLNLSGSRNLGKITGHLSRPQFHLSLLRSLASLRTYRHLAAKVGTSKGGRKQWQTTPKNLPRMQCARAISVTWLGSGSCQPCL